MLKVEVSKKSKLILFTLLLILNIVLRIPSIPHEKGVDSFYIQALANSITTFGQANWWINWYSVFGLYPYSYASGLPFYLSGISQVVGLTGTYMEKSILLYSALIGLYSVFTAYVLAKLIYKDFLFKYLIAFFFSTSQGILMFSTWESSARGLFLIILPLYIFILISKLKLLKKTFLLLTLGVFLSATHHYYYFLIPFTFVYITPILLLKGTSKKRVHVKNASNLNYLYIIGLITSFLIPFFSRSMITVGSRYGWITDMLVRNTRYVGPLIILAISGVTYLTLKKEKKIEEWYFLIIMLILIPFNYNSIYGTYILVPIIVVFISIAFRNLLDASHKSATYRVCIIILILTSTMFSSFYNHERTNGRSYNWFMKDSTYSASLWSNEYIPDNTYGFGIDESNRLFSTSDGHPIMPQGETLDLAYGFIDVSEINLTKISVTSSDYYLEGPYSTEDKINIPGKINWILENDIDYKTVVSILEKYNLTYFIMSSVDSKPGIESIKSKKSAIFDNGGISIWILD